MNKSQIKQSFISLMKSCVEGFTGKWDTTTSEGKDGFLDMLYLLEELVVHYKVPIPKDLLKDIDLE